MHSEKHIPLKEINFPQELSGIVLSRVHKAQKQRVVLRMSFFGSFCIGSLIAVLYAGMYFVQATTQTGFSQYISLLFSDGAALLTSWKEFSLLLVESVPLTHGVVVLITVGLFVWSLSKVLEKRKIMYAFH